MARKNLVQSLDEIPSHFGSEAEEQAFWDTHDISITLLRKLPKTPPERLPPKREPDTTPLQPLNGRRRRD